MKRENNAKILALTFFLLIQVNCALQSTNKDRKEAPQEIKLQCKKQCYAYDTNSQSIVNYEMCVDTCLRSNNF